MICINMIDIIITKFKYITPHVSNLLINIIVSISNTMAGVKMQLLFLLLFNFMHYSLFLSFKIDDLQSHRVWLI